MTLVTAQMSVSMDGFSAGPKHDADPQRWMDGPETDGGSTLFLSNNLVALREASEPRTLNGLGLPNGLPSPIRVSP
jgi:hypothetical protein